MNIKADELCKKQPFLAFFDKNAQKSVKKFKVIQRERSTYKTLESILIFFIQNCLKMLKS